MKALNVGLTEKETAMCFFAADANGDGVISREEFSNFMTAAVFAEDTLDMEADPLPKKCSLDNLKCIVLEVLERLCGGIESGDGTVILNRVSSVVSSLRGKFTNW